jgi:CO/xanthine dehydrogenase FAD-binding subunit
MQGGRIGEARLVYIGCTDRPKIAKTVSQAVATLPPPFADTGAIEQAVRQDLSPEDTPGLRGDTRIHLATVLTRRVLNDMSESLAA